MSLMITSNNSCLPISSASSPLPEVVTLYPSSLSTSRRSSRVSRSSSTTRMLTSLSGLMIVRSPFAAPPVLVLLREHHKGAPLHARTRRGGVGARTRRSCLLAAVDRQGDLERRAAAEFAFHLNRAAVLADDLLADGEAKARAGTHVLGGKHGLEDARQHVRLDAVARVRHLDGHFRRARRSIGRARPTVVGRVR